MHDLLRQRLLDALARLPIAGNGELALIFGQPPAAVHRVPAALLRDGLAHITNLVQT